MWREVLISDVYSQLKSDNLLPAIVFRTARAACDRDVEFAPKRRSMFVSAERSKKIQQTVLDVAHLYDLDLQLLRGHPHYQALIKTGIGAHHAGQLLMWRLLLEELMSAGLMQMLIATGTVAAGVDFPARSVVVSAHSRRGATGYENLLPSEFQQMSGRAGRRGKDTVGFCVVAPSQYCDPIEIRKISRAKPEPLTSSYFPSPSSVLNLLRYRNIDDLRFTVDRSLASFKDKRNAVSLRGDAESSKKELSADALCVFEDDELTSSDAGLKSQEKKLLKRIRRYYREADQLEKRQASLLEASISGLRNLGYIEKSSLSEKGYWSAYLCTSVVIELAEMVESKIFEPIEMPRLVMLVAAICGDGHRKYLHSKESPLSAEDTKALEKILERVKAEQMPGVYQEREVIPDAAYTVLSWLDAEDWHSFRSILFLTGVTEGDAARLISQTAEQLNQLVHLSETHPKLAQVAEYSRNRLLRPPLTELF